MERSEWQRRRAVVRLAAAAGAASAVLAGGTWGRAARAEEAIRNGAPLALPAVRLLDGSERAAAGWVGQVVVLYWWASWCPFCALQSPSMNALWLKHRGRGLQMLGLSIDRRPEDAVAYLDKRGYTFPSAWVGPELARVLPKPKGLPVTVVRGRDGRVALLESGQLFDEDVQELARFL